MKPLKVLLIEESQDDALLLLRHLHDEGYEVQSTIVQTAVEMKAALAESDWDIVLSDYVMPSFTGSDALSILKEAGLDTPIIIISGTSGEDVAVKAMLDGASDYLMKGNLTRLAPAIERELENASKRRERKQFDGELEKSVKRERAMIENALDVICTIDAEGKFASVSPASIKLWGYRPKELIGQPHIEFVAPEDVAQTNEAYLEIVSGIEARNFENRYRHKNGSLVNVMWTAFWSEKDDLIFCVAHDITKRKAAETEMRLMKSAIDSTVAGILITDAQKPGNPIIYVNSAFEKLTGYSFEEIEGQSCRFLQGADTNPQTVLEIGESIKQEISFRGEILNYRKNGETFWNDLIISPVFDQSGKLSNFVGSQQDITERKKIEKTLQASEAKIRQLVDSNIIGIITTDSKGVIIEANNVFLNSVGYSLSELQAGDLRWNTPTGLLWQDEQAKRQLSEFGYSNPQEKECIRKDGSRLPVLIGGTLLKESENSILSFVLDISVRKHAEDALRESELRLRTILETEPECVKVIGSKGELLEMNRAGLAIIEADSLEQARAAKVLDIIAPAHRLAFATLIKNVLAGSTENLEFEIIGLKGTHRWLETHAVPMRDQMGKVISLLGITRDVTERKRIEAERAFLAAQIKHQHQRLDNIVANVPGIVWETWNAPDPASQRIDFVSDFVEPMLGYTTQEWLTTPNFWLSIIHPEDRKRIVSEISERFLKEDGYIMQLRCFAKDGRIVWVESQATIIRDEEGRRIGLRGISIDITQRKRLEEERLNLLAELAAEKSHLQDIFDNSPSFIVSLRGPDFIFEKVNPAYCQLIGKSDLIGLPVLEALPDIMTQGFPELLNQVYKTGEPYVGKEVPLHLQSESGEAKLYYLNFAYVPKREADNSISGVVSYGVDVTEQVLSRIKIQESMREQQKLSDQLAIERMRLITAQSVAKVGSWEIDLITQKTNWSAETFHIFEIDPSQFQPDLRGFLPFVHPEDSAAFEQAFAESFDNHSINAVEHRILLADGRIKYIEERWEVIRDEQASPLKLVGTCQDITERKQAQQQITESEAQYRSIVETANEGIWLVDTEIRITYVNRQMAEMLGYTVDEMIGRQVSDFVFDEDLAAAKHLFEQRLIGIAGTGEFRLRRKDGSEIFTLYNTIPRRNQSGEIIGFLSMRSDITESKKAERELRNAEAKYRSLIESSPAIVYLAEPRPPYSPIYVSPNVIRFGYTVEEWFDRPDMWLSLVHQEDRERVLHAIEESVERNHETDLEYRVVTRAGEIIWLHDKGRFILDEQGNKTGWQGVLLDVTKTKVLEEQLRQSQKLESVGLLAGGIAHDFNNMLTAINGYSDLTLRKLRPDSPLRHNIQEIKKAGERSAALTNQLLAFSHQQILKPLVLDLNDVITETIKMLQRLIGENIELTTTLNRKIGRVKADPGQLSQVIMNLAVNARDAMPNGGKLTIETANVFLDHDYAGLHFGVTPGKYILLAISDTGSGMSDEVKSHIFEPFFTTKAVGKGTGLGLAIVYGIIKQSGGNLRIYSEKDVGTTFKIYLPLVTEQLPVEKTNAAPAVIPKYTGTILLVEDEQIVRELTCRILESCGFTVLEAANGLEALEICDRMNCKFDLLMTDVVMPQMGGRELAEKLTEKIPGLRILFTSGYTDDAVMRHGVIENNANFIQKPFTFESLAEKIRVILDG